MVMHRFKDKDEPFHSGEVYHLWGYLYQVKTSLVTLQVFINHSVDHDFRVLVEDLLESCFTQESEQIEGILKEAGIRLPPSPPDRPNVDQHDIPAGAKFNDNELAILVQNELMAGRILANTVISVALKEDIRDLFTECINQRMEYEQKILHVMKQKGWLVIPPINIK
ncbi:DUF3231 family protein [Oceanobacillus sp. 1P07AA]|uniref:DUF3231 family protein n=1 Tax=Oceanobacillus sp. 1P07AA TaxID=3132293 RepID=UPI0039A4A85B